MEQDLSSQIKEKQANPKMRKRLKYGAVFSVTILILTAFVTIFPKDENVKDPIPNFHIEDPGNLSGLVENHSEITFADNRYYVNANLIIPPSITLTISDSVVVFGEGCSIEIQSGALDNGNLTITNSVLSSETEWSGIDCYGDLNITGSALLNATTVINVNSTGEAKFTGSTITNSGTAVKTSSSDTTIENCLITGNDIGIQTLQTVTGPNISAANCRILNNSKDLILIDTTTLNCQDTILFMSNISHNGATINNGVKIYRGSREQTNLNYFETNQTTTSLPNGIHALYVKNTTEVTFAGETHILDLTKELRFIGTFSLNNATSSLSLTGTTTSALFVRLYNSTGQKVRDDLSTSSDDFDNDRLPNSAEWSSDVFWYEAEEFGNTTSNTRTWGDDYSHYDDLVLEPGHWDLYILASGSGDLTLFTDEKDYTIEPEDDHKWYKEELNLSSGLLGMLHTGTVTVDRIVLLPAEADTTNFSWYRSFDSDADGISDFAEIYEFFEKERYSSAFLRNGDSKSWGLTFTGSGNYMVKASGTLYQSLPLEDSIQPPESLVDTSNWDSIGTLTLLDSSFTETHYNSTVKPELSFFDLRQNIDPVEGTATFGVKVENSGEVQAENVTVFAVNRNGSAGGKVLIGDISGNSNGDGSLEITGLAKGTDLTLTAVSNNGGMVTDVLPVTSTPLGFVNLEIEQNIGKTWISVKGDVNNGTANRLYYGIDGWPIRTAPITGNHFDFTIPNLDNGTHTLLLKATGSNGAVGIHRHEFTVDYWYQGGITADIAGSSAELALTLLNKGGTPLVDTDVYLISDRTTDTFSSDNITTNKYGGAIVTLNSSPGTSHISVYPGKKLPKLDLSLVDSTPFLKPILEKDIYFGDTSITLTDVKNSAYAGPADYCQLEVDTDSRARIEVTSNRREDRIEAPEYTDSDGKALVNISSDIKGDAEITVKCCGETISETVTFQKSNVKIESCYIAKYLTNPVNPTITLNVNNSANSDIRFEVDYLAVHQQGLHSFDTDVDSDGLKDGAELANNSSPWKEDTDGDELTDKEEADAGSDPSKEDSDLDGIDDNNEKDWNIDSDGDGLINAADTDSDDDRLPDGMEDKDKDGETSDITSGKESDPSDTDTDDDDLPDGWEVKYGLNPTVPNNGQDFDEDGLNDVSEYELSTNPTSKDTDGDGIDDSSEVDHNLNPTNADTDGDGIWDGHEINWDQNTDNNGKINALDRDSDGDGIDDFEGGWWNYDTNDNGSKNMVDRDSDGDNITDGNEMNWWIDTDGDGLPNFLDTDSDNDGLEDWEEDTNLDGKVDSGESSPLRVDTDGDGLTDFDEVEGTFGYVTSPAYPDTDNDTLSDSEEYRNFTIRYRGIPEVVTSFDDGGSEDITTKSYWGKILVRTNVQGSYNIGTWIQVDTEWRDGKDQLISLGHLEEIPPEGGGSPAMRSRGEGSAQEQWGEHDLVMPDERPLWIITPYLTAVQVDPDTIEYYGTFEHYDDADEVNNAGEVNIYIDDGSDIHENQSVTSDPTTNDTDNDTIPDNEERRLGTNPGSDDTDGDGIDDFTEVEVKLRTSGNYTSNLSWVALNEGDGNLTFYQYDDSANFTPGGAENYSTPEGYPVRLNTNTSYACVELPNGTEIFYRKNGFQKSYPMEGFTEIPMSGTDPLRLDSDGDGLPDGAVEGWEYNTKLRGWSNTGIGQMGEGTVDTFPDNYDTDGDSLSDGIEAAGWYFRMNEEWIPTSSLPMDPDSDGDGLADGVEYLYTNGSSQDTDGDNLTDENELHVVFKTDAEFTEGSGLDYPNSTYVTVKTENGYKNYTYSSSTEDYSGDYLMPSPDGGEVYLNGNTIYIFNGTVNHTCNYYSSPADRPEPTASGGVNHQELYRAHTSPWDIDTDGDMIPDGYIEGWNGYDDAGNHDATKEPWEGEDRNLDGDRDGGETYPTDPDSDHDGIPDGKEYFYDAVFPYLNAAESPFNPGNEVLFTENVTHLMFDTANGIINPNIDGDSLNNALDTDSDADGIPDGAEDRNLNGKWDGTIIHKEWAWNDGTEGDTGHLLVNMTDWLVDRPMSYKITFTVTNGNAQPYTMPVDTTDIQGNWHN